MTSYEDKQAVINKNHITKRSIEEMMIGEEEEEK